MALASLAFTVMTYRFRSESVARTILAVVLMAGAAARLNLNPLSAQDKPAPAPTSATLMMDWSRGDRYYGAHFIQLSSPCQVSSQQKCDCLMQFKGMSSKENAAEFADYVSSFDHDKVPVTFKLSYTAGGVLSGAEMLRLGTWTRDKLPINDTLLGVRVSFRPGSPGQVQREEKLNSPLDCFSPSMSGPPTTAQ
jgi:hypothetical protein